MGSNAPKVIWVPEYGPHIDFPRRPNRVDFGMTQTTRDKAVESNNRFLRWHRYVLSEPKPRKRRPHA